MYRVVLVDDERLILRGLSTVVPWAELGCEVAGTAHDGADGLEQIRKLRPDIVLTDIRIPNMDGLTMLAAIRSEFPEIQMSVLTAYRDFDYARQAITLGVCRYLLKPSDLEELKDAVRQMVSRLDTMPRLREETTDDESQHQCYDGDADPRVCAQVLERESGLLFLNLFSHIATFHIRHRDL